MKKSDCSKNFWNLQRMKQSISKYDLKLYSTIDACSHTLTVDSVLIWLDSSPWETLLSAVGTGGSAGGAEGRSTSQWQEEKSDGRAVIWAGRKRWVHCAFWVKIQLDFPLNEWMKGWMNKPMSPCVFFTVAGELTRYWQLQTFDSVRNVGRKSY